MKLVCRFVSPYLSFLASYSGFGNADEILVSLYKEDFADPHGTHRLLDNRCGPVDPSPILFLELSVIRPLLSERGSWLCCTILYDKNW